MRPAAGALLFAAATAAQVRTELSGAVSSDLRFRLQEERRHDRADGALLLPRGWSRNENRLRVKLTAASGEKVKGVGDLELAWLGFSEVEDLDGLVRRERIDPYWLELQAAYLDVYDLLPSLDLRVGRQLVEWGTADQFNPTDNLNPLDLYDPLQFGLNLPNNGVRLDWHPGTRFTLTAAFLPVFRPARLPPAAPLALRSQERLPVQDVRFRRTLAALAGVQSAIGLDVGELAVEPVLPEPTLDNAQAGVRAQTHVGVFDLSASWFIGRDDLPQPYLSDGRDALGDDPRTRVLLMYPRQQVLGADLAASLPWVADVGVWAEAAVVFPQRVSMSVLTPGGELQVARDGALCASDPAVRSLGVLIDTEIADCGAGARDPVIVDDRPFPKWTVGADYSFTSQLYANAQWVHGFVDEFGAGRDVRVAAADAAGERTLPRQGDYLVGGFDHRSFSDTLLLRLFAIVAARDGSTVVFPQVVWSVWDGAELTGGAFVSLGGFATKFGDPAAGGTELFVKAKAYY